MAPSAIVERLDLGQALSPETVEILPLGKRAAKPEQAREIKPAFEFSKVVLLEENHFKTGSRMLDVAISVLLHVVVIAGPIFAGLYFTDTINIKQLASTMLIAPPPPPPALSAVIRPPVVRRLFLNGGKLFAPTVIPKQIAEIKGAPLEPDPNLGGVAGGVPGGVPGGQLGGVIGGVLSTARPVAPPSAKINAPLRIGGRVRRPQPLVQTRPEYPALARQAHIQGKVELDAVLDEHGNVVEMKIVSGPPVLYQAALDALRKWKYEPTYLNDQPIAVQMLVTISFQLDQ